MFKFAVGDKVVCVNEQPVNNLIAGREYTVKSMYNDGGENLILVEELPKYFFEGRFQLKKEAVVAVAPILGPAGDWKNWKVGDVLVCVMRRPGCVPEIGDECVITEITNNGDINGKIINSDKVFNGHYSEQFAKKEKAVEKKINFQAMTRDALREYARKNNIKGYSNLLKADLIELVSNQKQAVLPLIPKPAVPVKPSLGMELKQKTGNNARTCSYALEFASGHRRFQTHDVCHARLRSYVAYAKHPYYEGQGYEKEAEVVAVALNVSGHLSQFETPEEKQTYRDFVKYVITESPYSSVFLTKNVEDAFNEAVYLDVDKPLSWCVAGAIHLREGSEFRRTWLPSWKVFMDMGFTGKESWFLATFFRKAGEGFNPHIPTGGHMTVHGAMDTEDFLKFYKEGFHLKKDELSLRKNQENYSIFACIAGQRGVSINDKIRAIGGAPDSRWPRKQYQFFEKVVALIAPVVK
jgi:hypothetical protein